MNLNKVFLIGRLTQDPEARSTPSGQNVTTIRMATNRVWNDQGGGGRKESTEYHTVIAWGRLGDIASRYLRKGSTVMIEGRIQTRNWTDQSNTKKYFTEIIAENLQLGPKPAGSSGYSAEPASPTGGPPAPKSVPASELAPEPEIPIIDENEPVSSGVEEDEMAIKEKDLPF